MLVRAILVLSLLATTTVARGQGYFQQDVDYLIKVSLNDETDELYGSLELDYTNNSPDVLTSVPFHIWPNAYASRSSAFARQQLRNGDTKFHFAPAGDRGALDGLNFTVDGRPAPHEPDAEHVDVVHVPLPEPLQPGETIKFRTPFRVDIPISFSRLGHVGDSYQITQWYPKPAVYDREGWHAMPYLDRGEFYSEFGRFRVEITLPYNYVVGATGALQNDEELEWLTRKALEDEAKLSRRTDLVVRGNVEEPFPASDPTTKTLVYEADNVHDFAWFADKRFKVLHDTLALTSGRTIDVWSMFTEAEAGLWVNSLAYLKRSVRFYSDRVGEYPYPQVTGVQSALSAGGGMEYPMVTVIGLSYNAEALDVVLAHEVGHNWFYGILGSNERSSPWMDEGINSYYEGRYQTKYYEAPLMDVSFAGVDFLGVDENILGYKYLARQGKDQPPNTDADSLSGWNYWIQAYAKPALAMRELELYAGRAELDRAMRAYYERYKFKHPRPEDFFATVEDQLGSGPLPWLRSAMMSVETSDYKVGRLDGEAGHLHLAHSGPRTAPATAQYAAPDGTKGALTQVPGTGGKSQVAVPPTTTAARLPTKDNPLDLWTSNNQTGWRKPKLGLGIGAEKLGSASLFALPLLGYNIHDGVQIGAALHNRTAAPQRLEWVLAPLYGFGSSTLTGFGGARYRILRPFAGTQQLILSAGTQRWSDFTLLRTDEAYGYARSAVKAALHFDHPAIQQTESYLFAQAIYLSKDRPSFDGSPEPVGTRQESNYFLRLGYARHTPREIRPFGYGVTLEYKNRDNDQNAAFEASHLRLDATLNGGLQYERGHFFRYRAYGGYFLINDLRDRAIYRESSLSLVGNSAADYRRDGIFLGRSPNADQANWVDQQLEDSQGGFRVPIGAGFANLLSNSYMLTTNLDIDLPLGNLPVPLGVFLDAGYYGFKATTSEPTTGTFRWAGGVSLTAFSGKIGVYAPFIADPDTRSLLDQRGDLLSRISFRISLDKFLPWHLVDSAL